MYVERACLDKLIDELDKPFISILVGPRQVGKSTLMRELEKVSIKKGKKTQYFNLEDPRDLLFFHGDDSSLLNRLESLADVLFIDEFQYLKNATKLFKILYDGNTKIKIVASGSSAIEIHKHLVESLAGRYRKTQIFPLTYLEILKKVTFESFLVYGGMPGLLHEKKQLEKLELLTNIVQSYLLKDIKALIKEENIRAFNHLLYFLAQNQGSIITMASMAREIGLSEPTVNHYLEIMAQTYVCHPLESYSNNLANELKKSKKYYLFDLGIRNSILADFSEIDHRKDYGVLLESQVMLSILAVLKPNMDVKFWRTRQGDEVDFVLLKDRVPYPIEVKSQFDGRSCPKGLAVFFEKYSHAPYGVIVSSRSRASFFYHDKEIKIFSLKDFLLSIS